MSQMFHGRLSFGRPSTGATKCQLIQKIMPESAIYKFTLATYQELEKLATPNEYGELEFSGKLSSVIRRTGASSSYYTRIRELLDSPANDPCIQIIKRGAGRNPTVAILRHPPPSEWAGLDLTRARQSATLDLDAAELERLRAFVKGIGGINLREALENHESRISQLEREREKGSLSGKKANTNRKKAT